tara:strand:- start:7 stop:468 length:462 start_codon:yes stop_codon:yes gene_type:complete
MAKPFFIPQKEVYLWDSMNEELIDEIIGQTVDIYKIDVEESDDNIYGESLTKYFKQAFRVNCLVLFNEPTTEQNEFGPDTNVDMEMYFHRNSLADADFFPEIGDIVDWNDFYWEMNEVVEPQLIAGHPDYKHQIRAKAHRIRNSSLQIEERPR